jgi:hypothetical protein
MNAYIREATTDGYGSTILPMRKSPSIPTVQLTMCAIHNILLTSAQMELTRNELVHRAPFHIHVTELGSIDNLGERIPQIVVNALELNSSNLLCLRPVGSTTAMGISKPGPLCRLAVSTADLTAKITADWSFPEAWDEIVTMHIRFPDRPLATVFVDVAIELGSIAYYEIIPTHKLGVCASDSADEDPSQWPFLFSTANSEIKKFPGLLDVFQENDPFLDVN